MDRRPFEVTFRLGPIPVLIEPSFWLAALLLALFAAPARQAGTSAFLAALSTAGAVVFSLFAHELGHALVAQLFGAPATVHLYAFGGLTLPERRLSGTGELLVWLAGPGAGLLLAGLAFGLRALLQPEAAAAVFALRALAWINLGWAAVNLLPVLPLDGGHALLALLGPTRQSLGLAVSSGAAFAAAAGLGLAGHVFGSALFVLLALRNLQARAAAAETAESLAAIQDDLDRGWRALRSGNETEAERVAQRVLEGSAEPDARNLARDLLAWASLARSEAPEALRHLERSEPPEAARALTWALVLQAVADRAGAIPYARQALEDEPSLTTAQLLLGLLVAEGQTAEARALAERFAWPRPGGRDSALGEVCRAEGDAARAAAHYQVAFELSGRAEDALGAARAHARAGSSEQSLDWLERAVGAGLEDVQVLAADPDLELVRSNPRLLALLRSPRAVP